MPPSLGTSAIKLFEYAIHKISSYRYDGLYEVAEVRVHALSPLDGDLCQTGEASRRESQEDDLSFHAQGLHLTFLSVAQLGTYISYSVSFRQKALFRRFLLGEMYLVRSILAHTPEKSFPAFNGVRGQPATHVCKCI